MRDDTSTSGPGATLPVAVRSAPGSAPVNNLFGLDRAALRAEFAAMGEPAYRADQVMHWIYRRGIDDFARMSNLSKNLRRRLDERYVIAPPQALREQRAADGTRKWALRVAEIVARGPLAIETVFIPETGRGTLCVSSQAGCAMDCVFCSTGQQGFARNLNTAEMIAQVWFAERALTGGSEQGDASPAPRERAISNVVFMGMGEPLANYGELLPALRILLDDFGFGFSKRRVTVSTSGLVPFIDRLGRDCDTALAVSLHAPDDALRDELVPINRKYPLAELMAACRRYTSSRQRKAHIVYEYVMLDAINDAPAQARALARLLGGQPAKVNLIPFNPFPGTRFRCPPAERIAAFADELQGRRIVTTVRRARGRDIDAACGQLVGRIVSRQRQRLRDRAVKTS